METVAEKLDKIAVIAASNICLFPSGSRAYQTHINSISFWRQTVIALPSDWSSCYRLRHLFSSRAQFDQSKNRNSEGMTSFVLVELKEQGKGITFVDCSVLCSGLDWPLALKKKLTAHLTGSALD